MNGLQKALTKFARRYSGAGRDSFSLSRPMGRQLTEPSYGGVEVIKQPGSDMDRAANMPQGMNKGFREREKAIADNPLGGVGSALSRAFGERTGGLGAFGDDKYTDDGYIGEVSTDKSIPLGTEVFTRGIEQLPTNPGASKVDKKSVADKLRDEIIRRESKDFSKGGADYDKDHDWKDALRSAGLGALQALSKVDPSQPLGSQIGQALGGAAAGGISGAFDRNTDEKIGNQMALDREYPRWAKAFERESAETNQRLGEAERNKRMENIDLDNQYQRDSLAERRVDRLRKVEDRRSRETTSRMTQVAGMFKNLPVFDPNDPQFAEMKKALGDVNLPITPKDAKKKVDLKQDQRTGEWTVILTDPISGKQEVRSVVKDGKPFASTPTVVMQGEYGMLKQNDQQAFQGALEGAKMQAQLAYRQLESALGKEKALQQQRTKYVEAYQKATGSVPSEDQIQEYLNAIAGQ